MFAVPFDIAFITENWACMSVGNSGNGAVVISTGFGTSLFIQIEIALFWYSISAPASLSLTITFINLFGFMPSIVISPLVTAAAAR